MSRPFLLFHWSPVSRRQSILKQGLVPGKGSPLWRDGFRAPYICFCRTPSMAWCLSATQGKPRKWDLWCVWSHHVESYKIKRQNGRQWWKAEYRVPARIPKSRVWFVGTREYKSRRHA